MGFLKRRRGARGVVAFAAFVFLGHNGAMAADPSRSCEADCSLVVLGDSLSAAFDIPLEMGFPAQLQRFLDDEGIECSVIDAGVSGDTSAGALARVDWTLTDETTHMIVEIGGNDALRALPTEALERNLEAIVAAARAEEVEVLIAGMLAPPNLGPEYGEAFEQVYRDVASRNDLELYPFFLDGVAGVRELNLPDGIHPTAQGVSVIVDNMGPQVARWLEETNC